MNFMGPLPASVKRNDLWLRLQRKPSLEPCFIKLDIFGTWLMIKSFLSLFMFTLLSRDSDGGAKHKTNPNSLRSCRLFKTSVCYLVHLLLVRIHQAEIMVAKHFIPGCSNATRTRVEPMTLRSWPPLSSFGGASLPRQMEGPRPRVYPFTTLATKLLRSDANCKGLQPASCFVIQNH